jgi:hypothetical protein
MDEFSTYLPQTLMIIGVRHPILFFQSFWNMLTDFNTKGFRKGAATPYDLSAHCGFNDNERQSKYCNSECPGRQMVCMHKTRFHIQLAKIGKTMLDNMERQLLAPDDPDGGLKLTNHYIKNPIFLYELSEMKEDYMWDALAQTLNVPNIPHDIHEGNKDARVPHRKRINICDHQYDGFRAMIMPHAYNMSIWLCDYLVPVAKNESRTDVVIADPDRFCEIVKDYANDPCHKLTRMDNGTYTSK